MHGRIGAGPVCERSGTGEDGRVSDTSNGSTAASTPPANPSGDEAAVLYERVGPDQALAVITINRPAALGAMSEAAKEGLLAAVTEAAGDASVRAVLLASRGRAFCVGQDLRELADAYASPTPPDLGEFVRATYNKIVTTLAGMPKPVVVAINGAVAGAGLGIALACDIRWAARSAVFATAFAGIGLAGDSGITWNLNRLVGPGKTAALMYLNERIDAEAALELGLVNAVVEDDVLQQSAEELALRLAGGPTLAYAAIKQTLREAATQTLAESVELEAQLQGPVGRSDDHQGAVKAFFAKETAVFSGR
jgi:2-(1,2-epoxy-1,2-dihydrophenyl)acetyl-CoA isomerase